MSGTVGKRKILKKAQVPWSHNNARTQDGKRRAESGRTAGLQPSGATAKWPPCKRSPVGWSRRKTRPRTR